MGKGLHKHLITFMAMTATFGMAVSNKNWILCCNRNEPQYGIKVHKRTKPSKKRNKNRIKGKNKGR